MSARSDAKHTNTRKNARAVWNVGAWSAARQLSPPRPLPSINNSSLSPSILFSPMGQKCPSLGQKENTSELGEKGKGGWQKDEFVLDSRVVVTLSVQGISATLGSASGEIPPTR